ncbi:amino acid-binding ACT domain protein [Corynebacterium incognita]|uniref:Amino acid-binding ACT domain protein n=1 Tax=Corynebacterium incognita TaxID=2754725 RepID=A0A7G7CPA7_9CORY|nr:amino acid-binding ACT domain protein [Corynebacterium incognita]QNE89423.1 amino acid-binding ACT domain protein [Corynebacterium incognita]
MSFLIRVLLPDSPGSLGQLADAIGLIDGNIQSVDIVQNFPDGTVMDDMVVALPKGTMADELITAASSVPNVEVDSIRPFVGTIDRRGHIALLARVAQAQSRDDALRTLVDGLPSAMTSTWAIVADSTAPMHRVVSSDAAPTDDGTVPENPKLNSPRTLHRDNDPWVPEPWTLLDSALAVAPVGPDGLVVILGRTGGPDYLASEVEHLGNIGSIVGATLR